MDRSPDETGAQATLDARKAELQEPSLGDGPAEEGGPLAGPGFRRALRRLIELLPVIIALTALFSYRAIEGLSGLRLATPLDEVLAVVPTWVAGLMLATALVGGLAMLWLILVLARPSAAAGGEASRTGGRG